MKRIIESLEKADTYVIIILNISLIFILGLVDYITGIEIDFAFFYLIPIAFTSWYAGKSYGIYLSIVSEMVWFFVDMLGGHIYSSLVILLWNSLMRFILFIVIALLLSNFRSKIQKHYESELLLQKKKTIIITLQKLTAMIAENIISQNAEIIKWLNFKKNKGEKVSAKVDKASRIIASSMELLSKTSFVYPYKENHIDPDTFLELMKKNLARINRNFPPDIEK